MTDTGLTKVQKIITEFLESKGEKQGEYSVNLNETNRYVHLELSTLRNITINKEKDSKLMFASDLLVFINVSGEPVILQINGSRDSFSALMTYSTTLNNNLSETLETLFKSKNDSKPMRSRFTMSETLQRIDKILCTQIRNCS